MFFGGRKDNNSTGQQKVVKMDRFRSSGSLSPMRQAEILLDRTASGR